MQGIGGEGFRQGVGQGGGDLVADLPGRLPQFGIAGAGDHGERQHDCLRLFDGKHQRRQVEAGTQDITDAAFPFDRHAHGLKGGYVAIDRAHRHLQRLGNRLRGDGPARHPQDLDDFEQSRRLAHCRFPGDITTQLTQRCQLAFPINGETH